MKQTKLFSLLFMAILSAVSLTSCSSDEEEERANALRGESLMLTNYIEYLDGEEIDRGSIQNSIWLLHKDGEVEMGREYNRKYSNATWSIKNNAIVVNYYDDDELAKTERYEIENVYNFGCFVLRIYLDDTGTHYRRICGDIDSDKYDHTNPPSWWYEEWDF